MKPLTFYALGLITGIISAIAFFTRTPDKRSNVAPTTGVSSLEHGAHSPARNAPISASSESLASNSTLPSDSPDPLESALREIREAGMVVIPQELLGLYTPSFAFTRVSPAIQHTFRLDSRELAVLNDARLHFEQALMNAANHNLEIVEAGNDLLVVRTTTLPEQRRNLIASMRAEILRGLDEDSATLFAYLDMEKALGPGSAGLKNAIVRIRRVPGDADLQVTVSDGSFTRIVSMSRELLSQVYPDLRGHLASMR